MVRFNDRPIGERLTFIIGAAILSNVILIAIPGHFSHDELDWQNRILSGNAGWGFGLTDFRLSPFFRPLGAPIISIALRLPPQPLAGHAALVVLQSLNCCLLYLLVCRFRRNRALASGLLFAVMPGTAFAAGWVAAFYDLEFTFFALCSLWAAIGYWRGAASIWGALSVVAFLAGLLCKETAMTIPLAAAGVALCDRAHVEPRRVFMLCAAAGGVVLIYAVLRLPALMHTGAGAGGYAFARFGDMGRNALAYFSFPFAAAMPEISGLMERGLTLVLLPALFHFSLLVILWRCYGMSGLFLYLMAYFVPLLPVLIISKYETQYIYASSVALSVALAFTWRPQPGYAIPAIVLGGIVLLHAVRIQYAMYATGVCQTRALQTIAVVLPLVKSSEGLSIYAPEDTPWWVLVRAIYQNPFHVGDREIDVTSSDQADGTAMRFLPDCSVTLR